MLGKIATLFAILVLVVLVALVFSMTSTKVFAATNDTVTIDVNISSVSQITLIPNYLNWTLVGAGTAGGHRNITLKNTGSVNVSQIHAFVDTLTGEPNNQYGSSNASLYSAGGVLTIRNETDSNYYFLGRIEWNWTEDIPTHNWTAVTSPTSWGYFRNTTKDYVWVVGNGTGGLCNNSATQLAIESLPDLGTFATRSPDRNLITRDSNDSSWTYFSISRTPFYSRSCVAVYKDCKKIYIYSFDKRTTPYNFSACANSAYLYDGAGTEHPLAPGNTIILKVDPWVPYGIPAGNLTTTTLTVEANG
jgi:hypothetical protein